MGIKRVCVALSEENKEFVDKKIDKAKKEVKNRSRIINTIIDERRQDEHYNNRQNQL